MNEIAVKNELILKNNSFGWRSQKNYTCLDLGTMKNAIVIKQEEIGSKFLISLRSHFPFLEEHYKLRFDTIKLAMDYATDYLVSWIEELNKQLFSNQ
jgi:hypothetical protein